MMTPAGCLEKMVIFSTVPISSHSVCTVSSKAPSFSSLASSKNSSGSNIFRRTMILRPFKPPAMRPFSPSSHPTACSAANRATLRFASETTRLPFLVVLLFSSKADPCCSNLARCTERIAPSRNRFSSSEIDTFRTSITNGSIAFERPPLFLVGFVTIEFDFWFLSFWIQI
ncbi:hypothetical protein ACHAWX_002573 [Stephanocyclus meneghinianus]